MNIHRNGQFTIGIKDTASYRRLKAIVRIYSFGIVGSIDEILVSIIDIAVRSRLFTIARTCYILDGQQD